MTQNRRAATTRLEPGEHSIDRNTPTKRIINGQMKLVLDWSLRLPDGRLIRGKRTTGPNTAAIRRNAKRIAKDLLASGGEQSTWKPSSPIVDFLDKISATEIENRDDLSEGSKVVYRRGLAQLRQELNGHSIASSWYYDTLLNAVVNIAENHGAVAAKQARSVLATCIAAPLQKRRIVENYPLQKTRINFALHAQSRQTEPSGRGGLALTASQHERVIVALLVRDADADCALVSSRYGAKKRKVAARQQVIDLTLLQAGTGLRISEAVAITFDQLEVDKNGAVVVDLTPKLTKTKRGRRTPIADPRIAAYFVALKERVNTPHRRVIPAPSNTDKAWSTTGSSGALSKVAEFYDQLADELDIPILKILRSHSWRTTMTSRYTEAGVPKDQIAAMLGQTEEVNKTYYTDRNDISAITQAYLQHFHHSAA